MECNFVGTGKQAMRFTQYLITTVLFLLTGCVEMGGEVVCLTGVCASKAGRLADIPWNPQILEKKGCPNISGEFINSGQISSKNVSPGYAGIFLHLNDYIFFSTNSEFDVRYEIHQKIPSTTVNISYRAINGKSLGKGSREDDSEFYKSSLMSIWQDKNQLSIGLLDAHRIKYTTSTLNLNHSEIGCIDSKLLIRRVNAVGGIEGGLGSASAMELILQKLADGSLQLSKRVRSWPYSNSRGLLGINNPRRDEFTLIFPPAPKPLN